MNISNAGARNSGREPASQAPTPLRAGAGETTWIGGRLQAAGSEPQAYAHPEQSRPGGLLRARKGVGRGGRTAAA